MKLLELVGLKAAQIRTDMGDVLRIEVSNEHIFYFYTRQSGFDLSTDSSFNKKIEDIYQNKLSERPH